MMNDCNVCFSTTRCHTCPECLQHTCFPCIKTGLEYYDECANCKRKYIISELYSFLPKPFVDNYMLKKIETRELSLKTNPNPQMQLAMKQLHFKPQIEESSENIKRMQLQLKQMKEDHKQLLEKISHVNTMFCTNCKSGYVNEITLECFVCKSKHCNVCKSIEPHTCDGKVQINSLIRACPTCSILIEKNEGCSKMWCTNCKTAFDWTTMTTINLSKTRNFENVHYSTDIIRECGWFDDDKLYKFIRPFEMEIRRLRDAIYDIENNLKNHYRKHVSKHVELDNLRKKQILKQDDSGFDKFIENIMKLEKMYMQNEYKLEMLYWVHASLMDISNIFYDKFQVETDDTKGEVESKVEIASFEFKTLKTHLLKTYPKEKWLLDVFFD